MKLNEWLWSFFIADRGTPCAQRSLPAAENLQTTEHVRPYYILLAMKTPEKRDLDWPGFFAFYFIL